MLTEIEGIKVYVIRTGEGYTDFGYVVDDNSDIVIKTKLNMVELTRGEVNIHSYLKVADSYSFFNRFYSSNNVELYNIKGWLTVE